MSISSLLLTRLFDLSVWIFHVTVYEFIPVEVTPALYYLISQWQYCRYYGCVNRCVGAIAGRLRNAEKTVTDGWRAADKGPVTLWEPFRNDCFHKPRSLKTPRILETFIWPRTDVECARDIFTSSTRGAGQSFGEPHQNRCTTCRIIIERRHFYIMNISSESVLRVTLCEVNKLFV